MAGGAFKGFGITFLVLGVVFLVAGLAAAGFGAYMLNEEQGRGAFGDRDKAEVGQALVVGGGAGAALGLLLMLVGGILAAVGGSLARRELLRAVQAASPAPAAAPPPVAPAAPVASATPAAKPRQAGWAIAGGIVAILLVGIAAVAFMGEGFGGGFLSDGSQRDAPVVVTKSFTGHVQGGRAPVVGGLNTANADAIHELPLAPGIYSFSGTLNWSAGGPGGAATLVLILEKAQGSGWTELARDEGGPGLTVQVPAQDLPNKVRARVFVGGSGVADQDYALDLTAVGPS